MAKGILKRRQQLMMEEVERQSRGQGPKPAGATIKKRKPKRK